MNKRIKRIIALALTISAFSTFSSFISGSNLDFVSKPVYAAIYEAENGELSSLKIKSSEGETLKLKDGYNGDVVKLSEDKEYYVKMTDGSQGIKINAEVEGKNRVAKIFTTDSDDEKGLDLESEVLVGKGYSTIYIRTYKSSSEYRKAYKNNKVSDCEETYVIHVMKTVSSSNEDTSQDSIYLKDLDLGKGKIDFFKGTTSYTVKLSSDVESIRITAKPENSSDRVRINGKLVDEKYRRTVDLDKGKNEVKVKVTDDKDNQRTYTLNIIRGKSSDKDEDEIYLDDIKLSEGKLDFDSEKSEYTVDLDEDVSKIDIDAIPENDDYLVTIDGDEVTKGDDYEKTVSLKKGENIIKIVVEDELNELKRTYKLTINRGEVSESDDQDDDSEDLDDNSNSSNNTNNTGWVQTDKGWQYKDTNGNIVKSKWLYDENTKVYCYLNEDGFRKTGWFKDKGVWYLLADNGAMLTGWQKDGDKYYYMDSNGAMLTGWLKQENSSTEGDSSTKKVTWYYLNPGGDRATGWIKYGDSWYYMNSDGTMATGWIIDAGSKYYLNEDGSMQTGTKVIDGKEYKFNNSGAVII